MASTFLAPENEKMFLKKKKISHSNENIYSATVEPTIQRKKRPDAHSKTAVPSNKKFSTNVTYKPKVYQKRSQTTPPPAPRPSKKTSLKKSMLRTAAPPPPVVQVDTGALPKHEDKKAAEKLSVVRKDDGNQVNLDQTNKRNEDKRSEKADKAIPATNEKVKSVLYKDKKVNDKRSKRKGKMHEFVQTDMTRQVADSGQEAPYRAKVPPPRPNGPKRLSEYQMQFKWKDKVASTPLLAAEQIVHGSSSNVSPSKSDHALSRSRRSEYTRSFQDWEGETRKSRSRNRPPPIGSRSKSVDSIKPSDMAPAGSHKMVSPENKRLRQSINPHQLFFPHGKQKRYTSEYDSNFRPPTQYEYADGAWRGAKPPHTITHEEPVEEPPQRVSATWFNEVQELRKRAEEYKRRALGTHFGREHLAQLFARQAELWDTVSSRSSLDALSLQRAEKEQDDTRSLSVVSTAGSSSCRSRRSSKLSNVSKSTSCSSVRSQAVQTTQRQHAWQPAPASTPVNDVMRKAAHGPVPDRQDSDDDTLCASDDEGRMPTPKLREKWSGSSQRHHLDLTTPSVGGALLTSPEQKTSPASSASPPVVSKSLQTSAHDTSAPVVASHMGRGHSSHAASRGQVGTVCDDVTTRADPPVTDSAQRAPAATPARRLDLRDLSSGSFISNNPKHDVTDEERRLNTLRPSTVKPPDAVHEKTTDVRAPECILPRKGIPYTYHRHDPASKRTVMVQTNVADKEMLKDMTQRREQNKHQNEQGTQMRGLIEAAPAPEPQTAQRTLRRRKPADAARSTPHLVLGGDDSSDGADVTATTGVAPLTVDTSVGQFYHQSGPAPGGARRAAPPQPTLGMPTRDSHVLVDEEADNDAPLNTHYVRTPLNLSMDAISMSSREPHNPDTRLDLERLSAQEEDVLSVSARSLASSSSLASEVLERAKERKNHFWR